SSLHATDKIQRDIESILARSSWYYERRRNYYKNAGKPPARFVSPAYVASACVALVLRNPLQAVRLKSRFMRRQESYEAVFDASIPIAVWVQLVEVYKAVDAHLPGVRENPVAGERFLGSYRPIVALLLTARRLGTFNYSNNQFAHVLDSGPIAKAEV